MSEQTSTTPDPLDPSTPVDDLPADPGTPAPADPGTPAPVDPTLPVAPDPAPTQAPAPVATDPSPASPPEPAPAPVTEPPAADVSPFLVCHRGDPDDPSGALGGVRYGFVVAVRAVEYDVPVAATATTPGRVDHVQYDQIDVAWFDGGVGSVNADQVERVELGD